MLAFDETLFRLINQGMACGFLDWLMPLVTDKKPWIPVILGLLGVLAWRGGLKGRIAIIGFFLAVGLTDPFCSQFLKPLIGRVRPCRELMDIHLIWGCGGKWSFPSNHAANSAAMALSIGYFYRKWLRWTVPAAMLIGFSRIYVGVHYPGDVLAGLLIGGLIGWYVAALVKWQIYERIVFKRSRQTVHSTTE